MDIQKHNQQVKESIKLLGIASRKFIESSSFKDLRKSLERLGAYNK